MNRWEFRGENSDPDIPRPVVLGIPIILSQCTHKIRTENHPQQHLVAFVSSVPHAGELYYRKELHLNLHQHFPKMIHSHLVLTKHTLAFILQKIMVGAGP